MGPGSRGTVAAAGCRAVGATGIRQGSEEINVDRCGRLRTLQLQDVSVWKVCGLAFAATLYPQTPLSAAGP
jgi:hypothetical protein